MEIEHARESIIQHKRENAKHVAVDLEQFRNHEVGKGYKATFVVRQSSIGDPYPSSKKSKKEKDIGVENSLINYLACEGFRRFRKELQKIEDSV